MNRIRFSYFRKKYKSVKEGEKVQHSSLWLIRWLRMGVSVFQIYGPAQAYGIRYTAPYSGQLELKIYL